jgi:hypothetical protein
MPKCVRILGCGPSREDVRPAGGCRVARTCLILKSGARVRLMIDWLTLIFAGIAAVRSVVRVREDRARGRRAGA